MAGLHLATKHVTALQHTLLFLSKVAQNLALHVQATGGGYAHQRAATQERIVARYENFGKGLSATYGLPMLALGPLLLGIRKPYTFFATQ